MQPSSAMPADGTLSKIAPVIYSTATAERVAGLLTEEYDLRDATCALLSRGFNDVYDVITSTGKRFILRISGHRNRGPADVGSETAFLAHLQACDVPVATALPTRKGKLSTTIELPDGTRPAVLFHRAGGRRPDLDSADDARLQGEALARVHQAAERYPERNTGFYRIDLRHLLFDPVERVQALGLVAPQARANLVAAAKRLAQGVKAIDDSLTLTRIHGDCHGLNARIVEAGISARHAILFDFDDGGFGFLAYDLAVHLWAQVSFGRKRHAMWHAFDAGYRSVCAVEPVDEEAIRLFVPIRHIWLMGEYAAQSTRWGTEFLTAAWLEREVAFITAWEQTYLSPRLL